MEACAVHSGQNLIAVSSAGARDICIFSSLSFRKLQTFATAGCSSLTWHPEGPTLAAYVVRGSGSIAVLIFTNSTDAVSGGGDENSQRSGCGFALRCAHTISLTQTSSAPPSTTNGLCWASGHLLVSWSTEIAVWGCSFTESSFATTSANPGAHFLYCTDEQIAQWPLADVDPVSSMVLDGSQRFLATTHTGGSLWVWSVLDGCSLAAAQVSHKTRRRRPLRVADAVFPPSASGAQTSRIDGIARFILEHSEAVSSLQWRPCASIEQTELAMLVSVTRSGRITIWRENATSEALGFFVEAFWLPTDFWSGVPGTPQCSPSSAQWAQPRSGTTVETRGFTDTEDLLPGAGLPLRANRHVGDRSAEMGASLTCPVSPNYRNLIATSLVVLRADGHVAVLHMQQGNSRNAHCPWEIRRVPLAVPLPTDRFRNSVITHAAVVLGETSDALEVWLTLGSDMVRARLEQNEQATILAASGGVLPHELVPGSCFRVARVAVHRVLGIIACHVTHPGSKGSLVWISDAPHGRSSLFGERYQVSETSLSTGGHGVIFQADALADLLWAPGRIIPPVLLGVNASDRELSARVVDPVRGVMGPGAWSKVLCCLLFNDEKVVQNVQQIRAVCEDDDERSMLCLVQGEGDASSERCRILLARYELNGSTGAHTLQVLFVHTSSSFGPGLCVAVEWMSATGAFCSSRVGVTASERDTGSSADCPKAGDLVGQLAIWPGWSRGASLDGADVCVHTLVVEEAHCGSLKVCVASEAPQRLAVVGGAKVLDLAVTGRWLVALTSHSHLMIWSLTSEYADAASPHAAPLWNRFTLITKPLSLPKARDPSKPVFRPWVEQGAAGVSSGRTSGWHGGTSDHGAADITVGSLSLQRFACGGLGFLVYGGSETDVALPTAVICSQSASEGYLWHMLDLHVNALPLSSEALTWMNDGSILYAGPMAEKPKPLAVFAAKLPAEALNWLRASAPCPAYHPDTLFWLERRGQAGLAKRLLANLLDTMKGPRHMGIPPLVGVGFKEFGIDTDCIVQNTPPAAPQTISQKPALETASSLFADDDDDDIDARLARILNRSAVAVPEPDELPDSVYRRSSSCSSITEEADRDWRPPGDTATELAQFLQTTPLPLVSSGEQTHLMCLLQEDPYSASVSDLDECARRFIQAFELHISVVRRPIFGSSQRRPSVLAGASSLETGKALLGERLSSEDMCWALHSSCQGTIVDRILQTFGVNLDWPSLRKVGLGLWLTDHAALTKVLEALPRNIMKKQGKDDFEPESVALWYALLGKRTLLAALYKQRQQPRISEFLSNDLGEEPYRTKAQKNAFELLRQRRFEIACAFFIFAKCSHDAVDVCVRYLEDWPLAMLIAQQLKSGADPGAATEARRVLLEDLLPLAQRVGDPWLASIAHWHAGSFGEALRCVTPPYKRHFDQGGSPNPESSKLLCGGALRYGGVSPSLPRFFQVLKEALTKRRLTEESAIQISAQTAAVATSQAYLARKQPLLAMFPPDCSVSLPWRVAVGIARALVSLLCAGGQPLVGSDGSVVLAELASMMNERLGLPSAVVRAIISEVSFGICSEDGSPESESVFTDVAKFYSPSFPNRLHADHGEHPISMSAGSLAQKQPPYLQAYVGEAPRLAGTVEFDEEISSCRELRCLTLAHASRTLAIDERATRAVVLSALVWRTLPRLRSYLQDPSQAPLPAPTMHLAAHLICALCVSRPPAPLLLAGAVAPQPSELPGDLAHIVTALVVTLVTFLALHALTPMSGLWGAGMQPQEGSKDSKGRQARRSNATEAFQMYLIEEENAELVQSEEENSDGEADAWVPPWNPTFWQGLRVLFEHLQGNTAEQRRLHRSGVVPSLIVSLFLRPAFLTGTSQAGGTTAGNSTEDASSVVSTGNSEPYSPTTPKKPAGIAGQQGPPGTSESEDDSSSAPRMQPEEALRKLMATLHRNSDEARLFQMLLQCVLVELAVEWLVALFTGIRKKTAAASGHWITAWYEALLSALRGFLRQHATERVLAAAKAVAESHDRLALALCSPESRLGEAFSEIACSPGGHTEAFLALWQQLNGTRRLQILFAHHPRLGFTAAHLPKRSTVLWKCGPGAPIRFVCVDSTSPMRLAVHARTLTMELHAGHAVRWFSHLAGQQDDESLSAEAAAHHYDSLTDRYVQIALGTAQASSVERGVAPTFDAASEMMLGHVSQDQTVAPPAAFGGASDVARFLVTLQHVGARVGGGVADGSALPSHAPGPMPTRCALLHAEAHPSRPIYAAAAEDSSMYLWAFGEPTPRCALPQVETERSTRPARRVPATLASSVGATARASTTMSHGANEATNSMEQGGGDTLEATQAAGREQKKCTLAWNHVGDRLLGVGSNTGVSLWTVGEGRGACQVCAVPTGSAHAKTNCGIFVSPGCVIATAGLRSESDTSVDGNSRKTWPHHAAGLCVWDTLSPPRSALVAHDGASDAAHQMPAEYVCLTWDANQQRILCGTKSGELRIFDLRQRKISQRFSAHESAVRNCFLMPTTQRFLTLSAAAELKIWSLSSLDCLEKRSRLHSLRGVGSVLGKATALTGAALLSDSHLVTGGHDGILLLTRL